MLSYLQGTLKECHPQYAVIESMGLGFHIQIPASYYFQMPPPGNTVTVYTYLQLKDDGIHLYGFRSKEERDFFKMLLGVAGIGPKAALSVLGHLSMPQISQAILNEDIPALTCIPGIGSKTAKRLVYELKEKLSKIESDPSDYRSTDQLMTADYWQDVQQALFALGYSPREMAKVKNALNGEDAAGVEELFKKALSFLAKE